MYNSPYFILFHINIQIKCKKKTKFVQIPVFVHNIMQFITMFIIFAHHKLGLPKLTTTTTAVRISQHQRRVCVCITNENCIDFHIITFCLVSCLFYFVQLYC